MEPKSPGPTSPHPGPLVLPADTSTVEGAGVAEADRLGVVRSGKSRGWWAAAALQQAHKWGACPANSRARGRRMHS